MRTSKPLASNPAAAGPYLALWLLAGSALCLLLAWFAVHSLHLTLVFAQPLQALWALAAAPLIEEWVFRATLQPMWQQRLAAGAPRGLGFSQFTSHAVAIGAVSLVFALCHWPLLGAQALWIVLPSLLLGCCWATTRKLWLCAALHSAFNASMALQTALVSA